MPDLSRRSGLRPALCALTASIAVLLVAGCSDDSPSDPGTTSGIRAPSAAQISLDLPSSVAPVATPALREAPCGSQGSFGTLFACVTRFVFSAFAVDMADRVGEKIEQVATNLAAHEIPSGSTVSFTEGSLTIDILWTESAASTDYQLNFTSVASGAVIGRWQWSLADDGGVSGSVWLLSELMNGSPDDPDGIFYTFDVNADGSRKSIALDLDLPDTPPVDDTSAPTTFRMTADKDAGMWTLSYGMYSPMWLSDSTFAGVPTVLLVTAVAGTAGDSNGVMKIVALDANATSVPVDAEQANGVCDYVVAVMESLGTIPPGTYTCPPANPFYVAPDGTVQEGGAPPAGYGSLVTALDATPFVTSNPTEIRDLTVSVPALP